MAFEATQHPRPLPHPVCLYVSPLLARYGFPKGHPFGIDRQDAFWREAQKQGLDKRISLCEPRQASRDELLHFHTAEYVDRVERASKTGDGFLDNGDTPAFPGVYEAAATVVGAALDGLWRIMEGKCVRTFQPIGGLHHARRDRAAGFCVFNDIGVVIETLSLNYGVKRVGYIDIDVHHGDGLYYPFESDQDMIFADIHEDGSYLYPGTGAAYETGKGKAEGAKLNIPIPPGAGDKEFFAAWGKVEAHLKKFQPEFFIFQCGADSVADDPLAHLRYTPAAHAHAAKRLCALAGEFAKRRFMAFGGGGYNRANLARAWSGVLKEMIEAA